jgi:hypothetical protein
MEAIMKKKIWLLVPLMVIIVAVLWYVSSTQWTRDFDLRYVEYVSKGSLTESSDYSYYLYEITNNTHHTLKDVSVVILVEDILPGDWKYEDSVASRIKPGETVEYKLFNKDYKEAAEELGEQAYMVTSVEIVKIKYSK